MPDRYLADGGVIAFVMPRSILTGAKQHAAFRQQYIAACRLLIDCKQVTPLFNVPACVVISKQGEQPTAGTIPLLHLEGQLPSRNAPLETAKTHLGTTRTSYAPLTAENNSPYLEQIIQGASIAPRCVWFVRPPQAARLVDQAEPLIETDASTERQAKAPWKGLRVRGAVEAEFLFATLLADNLLPFGRRVFSLLLSPLTQDRRGEVELLDVQEASRRGKSLLAEWLRKADKLWKKHRKSSSELLPWLNWQNKLMRQRPRGVAKLVYGAQALMSAPVWWTPGISRPGVSMACRFAASSPITRPTGSRRLTSRSRTIYAPYSTRAAWMRRSSPTRRKARTAQQGKGERHVHRRPFEVRPSRGMIPRISGVGG